MEEIKSRVVSEPDTLVETAAVRLAARLSKRLNREVSDKDVSHELYCIKYGSMTDNIPFNIEVYKELEESGINILRMEASFVQDRRTCYVNNPAGDRRRRS